MSKEEKAEEVEQINVANPLATSPSLMNFDKLSHVNIAEILSEITRGGFSFDSVFDIFSIVSDAATRLFLTGAANEGENQHNFFDRIAPLIIENLVTAQLISKEQGVSVKGFITKAINTGVDQLEDFIGIDINQDGKIGSGNGEARQVELLTRVVNILETTSGTDLNSDGKVGTRPANDEVKSKGCFRSIIPCLR